ncbi:hypothetical protein [Porphyromonas loveana]|uniref:hypothetical protein n=1 Tax=Porphyromonas loveana TaxID=1884669 RepID=UPI0035A05BC9
MNREFCNRIGVAIIRNSSAKAIETMLSSSDILLFPYQFDTEPFSLQSSAAKGAYGLRYEVDQEIIIDIPDEATRLQFSFLRRCVVCLQTNDGQKIIIGSSDYPAQVSIQSHLNKAVLRLKHISLTPHML